MISAGLTLALLQAVSTTTIVGTTTTAAAGGDVAIDPVRPSELTAARSSVEAAGDSGSTDPVAAEYKGVFAPILPSIALDGKTDGEATASGGISLRFGVSRLVDMEISPEFEVASKDGLARLFSSSEEDDEATSSKWRFGAAVSLHCLRDLGTWWKDDFYREEQERIARLRYDTCVEVCRSDDAAGCKEFKAVSAKATGQIDRSEFCNAGNRIGSEVERDLAAIHPAWTLSLGGRFGSEEHKFFKAIDAPAAGAPNLEKAKERYTNGGIALASVWTLGSAGMSLAPTIELLMSAERGVEAKTKKAEACQVVGSVAADQGLPNPSGDPMTARHCVERIVGPPTETWSLQFAAHGGLIPATSDSWRVALGARLVAHTDRPERVLELLIELPVSFNLVEFSEYTGKYKGALSLVPQMRVDLVGTERLPPAFWIALRLSSQRTLFGSALDRLGSN